MSACFARTLIAGAVRALGLRLVRPTTALLALILLAGTAPAPAPDCTEATARYVVRGQVERLRTSNRVVISVPNGYAAGWSCVSAADAQAAFARAAAAVGR
ncbi:MAG: hypothetical protein IPK75_17940 [Acidobacteria bacterium]|nr:hypothetical protein [Acidobacteriota bacterium]